MRCNCVASRVITNAGESLLHRVLDREQLVAGGAQMILFTLGAILIGYGETAPRKYKVLLNGIQQEWAGNFGRNKT